MNASHIGPVTVALTLRALWRRRRLCSPGTAPRLAEHELLRACVRTLRHAPPGWRLAYLRELADRLAHAWVHAMPEHAEIWAEAANATVGASPSAHDVLRLSTAARGVLQHRNRLAVMGATAYSWQHPLLGEQITRLVRIAEEL